jgi:hypothetical protein
VRSFTFSITRHTEGQELVRHPGPFLVVLSRPRGGSENGDRVRGEFDGGPWNLLYAVEEMSPLAIFRGPGLLSDPNPTPFLDMAVYGVEDVERTMHAFESIVKPALEQQGASYGAHLYRRLGVFEALKPGGPTPSEGPR